MGETAQILALWRRARDHGQQVCLATVVHVEGSSYRKPGARMLITGGGERAGTVSGGCLEAEISRKAWWLTQSGPSLEQYQSSFDEDAGGVPWGLGCGGTVWILLERDPGALLAALDAAQTQGRPAVIATRLAPGPGTMRVFADAADGRGHGQDHGSGPGLEQQAPRGVAEAAQVAWDRRTTMALDDHFEPTEDTPAWLIEYLAPPPRLTIFGAGDDAQPIARFADELGWRVTVADGRVQMLRPERFPGGVRLQHLQYGAQTTAPACGIASSGGPDEPIPEVATGVAPGEFAIVLTHSWEQDRALMRALLPARLAYLGLLGPLHRTERLLEQVAPVLGWSMERCRRDLHAPVGLDLGARDPASIALAIVADLQATATARIVTVQRAASAPAAVARA